MQLLTDKKKVIITFDKILKYLVTAELIIWGLLFLLVFIINWEGWFFGIRIAGISAGLYLLIRWVLAGCLSYLIIFSPKHATLNALLAFSFFCFLFLDSAVSTFAISGGRNTFPFQMGIFVVIPFVYLIIRLIAKRYDSPVS